MQTKFILCQDNPEGLQCLSFIPKAHANASFLFQAYWEVKDFVCELMGISRAIWGLSGNAEFVWICPSCVGRVWEEEVAC